MLVFDGGVARVASLVGKSMARRRRKQKGVAKMSGPQKAWNMKVALELNRVGFYSPLSWPPSKNHTI